MAFLGRSDHHDAYHDAYHLSLVSDNKDAYLFICKDRYAKEYCLFTSMAVMSVSLLDETLLAPSEM